MSACTSITFPEDLGVLPVFADLDILVCLGFFEETPEGRESEAEAESDSLPDPPPLGTSEDGLRVVV